MGQSSSSETALKSIKSSLGENRFQHVHQDGSALLTASNPAEAWALKLHLPDQRVTTLVNHVCKHVLELPQPAFSLAVYAHVACQSSIGARQDRSELCWLTFAEPLGSMSKVEIAKALSSLLLSAYKQGGHEVTTEETTRQINWYLSTAPETMTLYQFQRLAGEQPSLQLLLEHVFASCRYDASDLDPVSVRLPQPSQLLTVSALTVLNNNLPKACRGQWQRLFSTTNDGQSFATFMGAVTQAGACILVLQDEDGHVFGGFTSLPWSRQPQFYGKDDCFVFTCAPELRLYFASGLNTNYQYCNQGMQTLPNGLGMGGQLDYFALFLNRDLLTGHSKGDPSTTYRNPRLSSQETFKITCLEAWLVGPPAEGGPAASRSILDGNEADTAILEMAGKSMHSKHIREPHPEDSSDDDNDDGDGEGEKP
eukprot:m.151267 g.151267  ORF g.151267 m.151267 type:complete len:424 (-) comp16335_c0_seq9:1652-2923(-)